MRTVLYLNLCRSHCFSYIYLLAWTPHRYAQCSSYTWNIEAGNCKQTSAGGLLRTIAGYGCHSQKLLVNSRQADIKLSEARHLTVKAAFLRAVRWFELSSSSFARLISFQTRRIGPFSVKTQSPCRWILFLRQVNYTEMLFTLSINETKRKREFLSITANVFSTASKWWGWWSLPYISIL